MWDSLITAWTLLVYTVEIVKLLLSIVDDEVDDEVDDDEHSAKLTICKYMYAIC